MPPAGLTLTAMLRDQVIAHCRSRYPKEACGLLAGRNGTVEQVYLMRNVDDSPISYSMDSKEQLQVERRMREAGQQLVGVFHSHTASAAYPSSVDVRLAISPDMSYVLVSLQDHAKPEFKSYRITGTGIVPEDVAIR